MTSARQPVEPLAQETGLGARQPGRGRDGSTSLARKYLGGPYPWYGGRDQTRVTLTITVDKVHAMG